MEANCVVGVVVNRAGLNDEVLQSQSARAPNPQKNKALPAVCC